VSDGRLFNRHDGAWSLDHLYRRKKDAAVGEHVLGVTVSVLLWLMLGLLIDVLFVKAFAIDII